MSTKKLENLIKQIEIKAKESDFSGVISISGQDSAVYSKAFGFRDVNNSIPNNTETKFGMASGTKLFTALGIGKLIEQGKLSTETKIGEIDDSYHTFIDKDATIQQLLSHTSGIFDYFDEETIEDFDNYKVEIPWFELETPSDYIPLFTGKEMKFKPGARYSYSNGGYVLLGIIIEKISGQLYRDFIQDNVLKPAGMDNSGFFALNNLPENTANGYSEDRSKTNVFDIPIRGGGDGGLFTTTDDMRSLWKSLFSYKILNKNLTDQFLITRSEFDKESGYGSGIYKRLDDSMFYIVGCDSGVGFDSRYNVYAANMPIAGAPRIRSIFIASIDLFKLSIVINLKLVGSNV